MHRHYGRGMTGTPARQTEAGATTVLRVGPGLHTVLKRRRRRQHPTTRSEGNKSPARTNSHGREPCFAIAGRKCSRGSVRRWRIPLQWLACHIAVARGCDVDKPRHLAMSVTVE
jgi:hypothetical protein